MSRGLGLGHIDASHLWALNIRNGDFLSQNQVQWVVLSVPFDQVPHLTWKILDYHLYLEFVRLIVQEVRVQCCCILMSLRSRFCMSV